MYKSTINDLFKGTGEGSGASTMFEGWDNTKLSCHGIDPDNCHHIDVSKQPSILIQNYSNQRVPYITIIYLWHKCPIFFWFHAMIH